jgi:hypothetical protein
MGRPSRVCDVRVPGPLAPFADAYKVRLRERGYTPLTTVNELRQVAHLSRWLEEQGTGTVGLTSQGLRQFFVSRRAEVGPKGCSSQSLVLLLEVLREAGAVEVEPPLPVSSGTEAVIVSFWHYLVAERGVTSPNGRLLYFARPAFHGSTRAGRGPPRPATERRDQCRARRVGKSLRWRGSAFRGRAAGFLALLLPRRANREGLFGGGARHDRAPPLVAPERGRSPRCRGIVEDLRPADGYGAA